MAKSIRLWQKHSFLPSSFRTSLSLTLKFAYYYKDWMLKVAVIKEY